MGSSSPYNCLVARLLFMSFLYWRIRQNWSSSRYYQGRKRTFSIDGRWWPSCDSTHHDLLRIVSNTYHVRGEIHTRSKLTARYTAGLSASTEFHGLYRLKFSLAPYVLSPEPGLLAATGEYSASTRTPSGKTLTIILPGLLNSSSQSRCLTYSRPWATVLGSSLAPGC